MKSFAPILATLLIVGCAAQEEEVQLAPDFNEFVTAAALAWNDAWAAGDAAAMAYQYAEDAVSLPPGSEPIMGREAIESAIATDMALAPSGNITSVESFSAGDYGFERGTYVVINSEGQQVDHGKYLSVWKLVNGEWKIFRDIYNSSVSPHEVETEM